MRIGIVGAGLIGNKRAQALEIAKNNNKLVYIVDLEISKAKDLARNFRCDAFQNWAEVVNRKDIDAIIIATPNKFILPIALEALKNKKHVLCEKPLGRNTKESEKIIEAGKNSEVILKTGLNHRHHPAIYKAKKLVENGAIGNIYYIRCVYGHGGRPGYETEWRASKDLCGGGELLDQGVHVVDLFRWYLGEFDEVYGQINTFYWNMKVEDNAFAMFKTKKGQVAMMHTSWTQWKNEFLFEAFGEKGYLIIDGIGGSYGTETLKIGKRKMEIRNPVQYVGGPPDEEVIEFPGPDISWTEEWEEFASAIKENREPLGSGYDGLMANKLIEAVYQSARLNKPIKIK